MNGNMVKKPENKARHTFDIRFSFDGTMSQAVFLASMHAQSIKHCQGVTMTKAEYVGTVPILEEVSTGEQ